MVGSTFLATSPFAILGNTQESRKRGAGDPRSMADVCCDWRLQIPFVAFLVSSMDPSNVLAHCHNNGWLSLPCNKPICHFGQHPGVRAGDPRGMADVCCDWLLQIPFVAFLVSSMDPSNVLTHCHNNGWLYLPCNKPICHFGQHPGVKKKGGQVTQEVWLMFVVIGGCRYLLLP